jgi:hypothetical protein
MIRLAQGQLSFSVLAGLLLALGADLAVAAEPATLELLQTIPLKGAADRLDDLAIDSEHARLFVAIAKDSAISVTGMIPR